MIYPGALELDGIFQNYDSLTGEEIGDLFEQGIGEGTESLPPKIRSGVRDCIFIVIM